MTFLLTLLGCAIIAVVVLDVFLTVLYARMGASLLNHHIACWTWKAFKAFSKPFPRQRDKILSFCGPVILALLVSTWVIGMMFGSALIITPRLGTSFKANQGPTPTGLATGMYVAGGSMTTVGTSDVSPQTRFFRIYHGLHAAMGMSIITLTLTYFLEIYNALQMRNTLALKLHTASGETGDAAELLAGIGPRGQFQSGYTHLAEMAAEITEFNEAHHFYDVLMYFRFADPHYALSRLALLNLDLVSLIKSTLDDDEFGWVKESAAVTQIWRGSMELVTMLSATFLPQGMPEGEPDQQSIDRWKRRYRAALHRLQQAQIKTISDEDNGLENYIALRARWDRFINAFADHMAHTIDAIDPVGQRPESVDERQPFDIRLRSAG